MMKILTLGVTGLCASGAAWYMSDSPDFDRVVKKSPAQVYAAFSELAAQGTVTPPDQAGPGPRISLRVDKVQDRSIHYEIQLDRRPVLAADLAFAAAGDDGRQTRLTAELDVDVQAIGAAFQAETGLQTDAGVALSLVSDRIIDSQFARLMDHMADDIEAGRPLPPLRARDMGVREASARADSDPWLRRARAEARQEAASRPMTDARPMLDPNRAARDYLNGDNRDGNGGR
jgi:hypothetical protein